MESTIITFPHNETTGTSRILAAVHHPSIAPGNQAIIVGESPFHPLDHKWPDQPGDTGKILVDGRRLTVVECLTGASREGELHVGTEIPASREQEGWHWLVLHVVEPPNGEPVGDLVGNRATLQVDPERRYLLSVGHTACHLAALALNRALAARWCKPVKTDGLGSPDFDALAISSSRIQPHGSTDTYRIGKSLRKKGFDRQGLGADLPAIEAQMVATLTDWIGGNSPVKMRVEGPHLNARRTWLCELPEGTPAIACGGTHIKSLRELGECTTRLSFDESAGSLTLTTTARPPRHGDATDSAISEHGV